MISRRAMAANLNIYITNARTLYLSGGHFVRNPYRPWMVVEEREPLAYSVATFFDTLQEASEAMDRTKIA